MTAITVDNYRVFGSLEIWFTYASPDDRLEVCPRRLPMSDKGWCLTDGVLPFIWSGFRKYPQL